MAKSPLRWVGSKRSLLPDIISRIPANYNRYIEPFAGSGCVFFATEPATATISDFNAELIQFYVQLRDAPEYLLAELDKLNPNGDDYLSVRSQNHSSLAPAARAARFLYLNRFAFNGLYRTNRHGDFNVPRGSRSGSFPTREELVECSETLKGVDILNCDYLECLKTAQEGDFVYLDPPYRNTTRSTYGEYGYGSFGTSEDVSRLAVEIKRLSEIGVQILLSFNEEPQLEEALSEWDVTNVSRRRSVSGKVTGRTVLLGEILAQNITVSRA